MQIIVLGAGAIGSLYGAKLAEENNVTLVGRAEHVRSIQEKGLEIEGLESRIVRVRAVTRLEHVEPATLILLTTKVPATASALEPIAGLIRDDTTLVVLQNGLNAQEIARQILPAHAVILRGITQFGAIFEDPGKIRYMASGYTILEDHARSAFVASVFNKAGLDCRIARDINAEVWRKLVFNCVVNPITTIIGGKVGDIADPELNQLKQRVIDECIAVAAAEHVRLGNELLREINATYAGSNNIVSMQQDILRGAETEIDYLNGAIVTLGHKHGLECAVNDGLTQIIKGMEALARRGEMPQTTVAANTIDT